MGARRCLTLSGRQAVVMKQFMIFETVCGSAIGLLRKTAMIPSGLSTFALLCLGVLGAATASAGPAPSLGIEVAGQPETIYEWTRNRCDPRETVDAPPRAFRDSSGTVHLYASHDTLRQFLGRSLDDVRYDCRAIRRSTQDDRPEMYADHQWLAAPYTVDGRVIYALVHNEFQGNLRPALCPSRQYIRCWFNALTLMISRNGGQSYEQPAPPAHLVAALPYRYVGDIGFPVGYFQPSNIVELSGYYYALIRATRYLDQPNGVCVMRTMDLADPASWRAWNGSDFSVRFIDPYTAKIDDPRQHLCSPVKGDLATMGGMARDKASGAFVLITKGAVGRPQQDPVLGIWARTSYDLVDWSNPVLVWADPSGGKNEGDPRATDRDPSLLDPTSDSRNFDTIGSRPYVYFVRMNPDNRPYDRRLMRVPIRITVTAP